MWDTWVWSLGQEDLLEKDMATPSGILAWKIPWMEESCGPQFMGSQSLSHDWAANTFTFKEKSKGKCHGKLLNWHFVINETLVSNAFQLAFSPSGSIASILCPICMMKLEACWGKTFLLGTLSVFTLYLSASHQAVDLKWFFYCKGKTLKNNSSIPFKIIFYLLQIVSLLALEQYFLYKPSFWLTKQLFHVYLQIAGCICILSSLQVIYMDF